MLEELGFTGPYRVNECPEQGNISGIEPENPADCRKFQIMMSQMEESDCDAVNNCWCKWSN